jgi:hypothetical protein
MFVCRCSELPSPKMFWIPQSNYRLMLERWNYYAVTNEEEIIVLLVTVRP